LITVILLERKARGDSYFGYFYARRVRRIVPPYLLLLVVSSILFGVELARHWPWYAFFSTNIGPVSYKHHRAHDTHKLIAYAV
ncbi:hypothetical protein AAHH80_36400, partial [Burkholderia pseudomallei]